MTIIKNATAVWVNASLFEKLTIFSMHGIEMHNFIALYHMEIETQIIWTKLTIEKLNILLFDIYHMKMYGI